MLVEFNTALLLPLLFAWDDEDDEDDEDDDEDDEFDDVENVLS